MEGVTSRNCVALVLKESSPYLLKSPRLMVGFRIEGRTSDRRAKIFTELESVAGKTEDNGTKWWEAI